MGDLMAGITYSDKDDFDEGSYSKTEYSEGLKINGIVDNWWNGNYQYRKEIYFDQVHSGCSGLVTFTLLIDHAALVSAGKSLANGNDVRIVIQDESDRGSISYTEKDRIMLDPNTASSEISFRISPFSLPSDSERINANTKIYLYYGYSSAGSPPTDSDSVFLQYDHFTSDTSSKYENEENRGSWTYDTGNSRIEAHKQSPQQDGIVQHKRISPHLDAPYTYELEFRFLPHWFVDLLNNTSDCYILLNPGEDLSSDSLIRIGAKYDWVWGKGIEILLLIEEDTYYFRAPVVISDDEYHTLRIILKRDKVICLFDDFEYINVTWEDITRLYPLRQQYTELPDSWTYDLSLIAQFTEMNTYFYIDYYFVQYSVDDPPELFTGDEEDGSSVTSGNWISPLIDPDFLVQWDLLQVSYTFSGSSESIGIQILNESLEVLHEVLLNQRTATPYYLTFDDQVPVRARFYLSSLAQDYPKIISFVLQYTQSLNEDSTVIIGTVGVNALTLDVDRRNGVTVTKPNLFAQLEIPERDGNIVQFMGSRPRRFRFDVRTNIQKGVLLTSMSGTVQQFKHNFCGLLETIMVNIVEIEFKQKRGVPDSLFFSLTLEEVIE
ncbi:TPA_asm: hypothetical protein vir519_00031 [Caudoviricetes sp. vir519]|nr:TPA_asm: hypothetical protein vir519_00031 [Caudoviricetes sp. vir519]